MDLFPLRLYDHVGNFNLYPRGELTLATGSGGVEGSGSGGMESGEGEDFVREER